MIHWTWVVFTVVIVLFVIGIAKSDEGRGDYSFNIMGPFLIILMIAFIAVWGGIFWW